MLEKLKESKKEEKNYRRVCGTCFYMKDYTEDYCRYHEKEVEAEDKACKDYIQKGEPTHNYPLPVEAIVVLDEEPFSKLQKVFKNFESEKK